MSKRHRYHTRFTVVIGAITAIMAIGGTATVQADDIDFVPAASISVDAAHQLVGGTAMLMATAQFIDIPSSPYYLTIYDATTGSNIAKCNANVCSKPVSQNVPTTHNYRAYITPGSSAQAISNGLAEVNVTWSSSIVLNASPSEPGTGNSTLTAKSAFTGTIVIRDKESGQTLRTCPHTGGPIQALCSVKVSNPSFWKALTHTYVATQTVTFHGVSSVQTSNDENVHWSGIPG